MKFVKLHKFVCRHDYNPSVNLDVYVNPEAVTWFEETFDDGKRHACIYLNDEDFVNVYEQVDEVVRLLTSDAENSKKSVNDGNVRKTPTKRLGRMTKKRKATGGNAVKSEVSVSSGIEPAQTQCVLQSEALS